MKQERDIYHLGYNNIRNITVYTQNLVQQIDRIHRLEIREPLVLRQLAKSWPACSRWHEDLFRTKFGDRTVAATVELPQHGVPYHVAASDVRRSLLLKDFVDELNSRGHCYLDQYPVSMFEGCLDDLSVDELMGPRSHSELNLWFGRHTKSGLHYDLADNFVIMIRGCKFVALAAQEEARYLYPFEDVTNKSQCDVEAPDFVRFPLARQAKFVVGELTPGDVLFIPQSWWHYLASLGEASTISVNCWWRGVPAPSMRELLVRTLSLGPRYSARCARDFVVHGVAGRPFRHRNFSPPPDGVMYYNALVAYLKRLRRAFWSST